MFADGPGHTDGIGKLSLTQQFASRFDDNTLVLGPKGADGIEAFETKTDAVHDVKPMLSRRIDLGAA